MKNNARNQVFAKIALNRSQSNLANGMCDYVRIYNFNRELAGNFDTLGFSLFLSFKCVCWELIETHKLQLNTAKWRKKAVQIFRVDKFSSFRCLGKVVAVVYKPVISPPKLHSRSPSNWSRGRGFALARDEKGCTIVLNGYVNK